MSASHLPAAIVAATTALAVELSSWAEQHPDASLTDLETTVLAASRRAATALLHGALLSTQRTLPTTPVRCPDCRHPALVLDWRQRHLQTICGLLCWQRPWAWCGRCRQSFGAGDASLGIAAGARRTAMLSAQLVALGSSNSFREAAELLELTKGTPTIAPW